MQECIFFDAEHMILDARGIVAPSGMRCREDVFAFYSSTLSFPDYFGWNWDAFDECIHDLSWLEGPMIHIVHPDIPLANDPKARAIMLSSIHDIKLYSRTNGKLSIHFTALDKQEILDVLVGYYKNRGSFGVSNAKWECGNSSEELLKMIDKDRAISYAKMGFLKESEPKGRVV